MVFTIAIFMTAFMSWVSGWIYDRWGPSVPALLGAAFASSGFFLSSFATTLGQLYFFFGVMGGVGAGLGCTVIVTVLSKWFPDKRGLAVGISVGAFSASSAVFGPIAAGLLIPRFGTAETFQILGVTFFVMTSCGALLLKDPPRPIGVNADVSTRAIKILTQPQFSTREMIHHPTFYFMWMGYALGSASGLMVISQLAPYLTSRGIDGRSVVGVVLVVGAIASIVGRILSGWMSDAWGRLNVLRLVVAVSAVVMPILYEAGGSMSIVYASVGLVYFCYGAQFCINAATCADFWGTKHLGLNYGIVLTAWGVGGVIGPRLAGVLFDAHHNYRTAFLSASILGFAALIFEFFAKQPSLTRRASGAVMAATSD